MSSMRKILISPSLLSADFSRLADELQVIEQSGADWVHLDVMDGNYVPNLTFGMPIIKSIRKHSQLPFDVHLMINQPERYIEEFKNAGADRLTFHVEACKHSHRYLTQIKELGMASGISLNPQTPLCFLEHLLEEIDQVLIMSVNPGFGGQSFIKTALNKIEDLRSMIDKKGLDTIIQVDGGIGPENMQRIVSAGADVLVMGSAFFNSENKTELVRKVHTL